jgi:hypothetical protein
MMILEALIAGGSRHSMRDGKPNASAISPILKEGASRAGNASRMESKTASQSEIQ